MGKNTKSREISEKLRQEILSGKFDTTRKLPSEHQLMRRFSVARETVRAALKELLDRNLVDRRPGYGTFLVERAEISAARKFGVIMPDAYYPFYARICRGIELASKKQGWAILSAALGSGGMRERALRAVEFAEVCNREKVSGVFFQPLQFLKDSEKFNRTILKVFANAKIPVVLLDSDFVAPPMRSEYDLVGVDNTNVGYALAHHVIAAGAKRLIYFSSPLPAPTSLKRGTGVGVAVTEAGFKWTKDHVFFADPEDTWAAERLFRSAKRPDAIIAANDYIAAKLLKTLKLIGKRVPEDVLLAGVNGDPVAEESDPPLTTMAQPCERIGEAAVQLMFQRLADPELPPREARFGASLVTRRSTCRAKPSRLIRVGRKAMTCASLVLAVALSLETSASVATGRVRWRGFNLLQQWTWSPEAEKRGPEEFREADFRLISQWGFNFVRIPLDYRWWTHGRDWLEVDNERLRPIDRCVEFGRKYGVHVQLCFHRIPGYCVNAPAEPQDLFAEAAPLEASKRHWAAFARRYRHIGNDVLSFNLMNEPQGISESVYAGVAKQLIDAIRREDPNRLIFSDGLDGGQHPVGSLVGLPGVAQAMRGYRPLEVSHWHAPWCPLACSPKPPDWPIRNDAPVGLMFGPGKSDMSTPLVLEDLPSGRVTVWFGGVSGTVTIEARADGEVVSTHELRPESGGKGWSDVKFHPEWNITQGVYDGQWSFVLPCAVKTLVLSVRTGDWCQVSSVVAENGGRCAELRVVCDFKRPFAFRQRFMGFASEPLFAAVDACLPPRKYADDGREFLYRSAYLSEWDELLAKGVPVMVGEFAAVQWLPHPVALAFLEDYLKLWKERNVPWAMWSLEGGCGIVDSGRADAEYVPTGDGRQVDRKMLELLQRY